MWFGLVGVLHRGGRMVVTGEDGNGDCKQFVHRPK